MKNLAKLVLENGTVLSGKVFGAMGEVSGEICFNTGMTGYQEILTDPSYCGQLIIMTYPHIGNYGINEEDFESKKIQASGLIIRQESIIPSNFRSSNTLSDFLKKNKQQFNQITLDEDIQSTKSRGGQSNESYVIQRLKHTLQHHALTDHDEKFLQLVLERYYEGDIPKSITKRIKEKIEIEAEPLKMLYIVKREIPPRFLEKRNLGNTGDFFEKDEIVLSEWLEGDNQ